jgi:hypothetical protein
VIIAVIVLDLLAKVGAIAGFLALAGAVATAIGWLTGSGRRVAAHRDRSETREDDGYRGRADAS